MLIRNFNKESFIKSYSIFFDIHSTYYLTMDEFYMYCFLYTSRMYDDCVRINIHIINDVCPYRYAKTDKNNLSKIKGIIQSLINKNIIKIHNVDVNEIKNNTTLELEFNPIFNGNDTKLKNYKPIFYLTYRKFESPQDLYIYAASIRYSEGTNISYEEWGQLLNCTDRHAINIINDAVERGVIKKEEGKYYSPTRQEVNTYSEKLVDVEKDEGKDYGNWYNWNEFITEDDIDIYLKNIGNEKLQKQVDDRMKVLKDHNKKAYNEFNGMIKRYHKDKLDEVINGMLDKNIDSIVVVNDSAIYVKDWDGKGKVKEYHYKKTVYDPFNSGLTDESLSIHKPDKEQIELYRPINGVWKHSHDLPSYGYDIDTDLLLPDMNKPPEVIDIY